MPDVWVGMADLVVGLPHCSDHGSTACIQAIQTSALGKVEAAKELAQRARSQGRHEPMMYTAEMPPLCDQASGKPGQNFRAQHQHLPTPPIDWPQAKDHWNLYNPALRRVNEITTDTLCASHSEFHVLPVESWINIQVPGLGPRRRVRPSLRRPRSPQRAGG